MDKPKRRPFSCGTQYLDWQNNNCCQCRKYLVSSDGEVQEPYCELEYAIAIACICDGTISGEHADRLGLPAKTWAGWRCREFEPEQLPTDTRQPQASAAESPGTSPGGSL
jgi:hypothetical protein